MYHFSLDSWKANSRNRIVMSAALATMWSAATLAGAEVITFDAVVGNPTMFGRNDGSTAEVVVSYDGDFKGWDNGNAEFPDGDGASGPAIYNSGFGTGYVILMANPGWLVQLDSVVLRMPNYGAESSSLGALEYSFDGNVWIPVPTNVPRNSTGVIAIGTAAAAGVGLRWIDDPTSSGNASLEAPAGLDNITFTAVPVPEPSTLVLGGASLAALLGLSRRRLQCC